MEKYLRVGVITSPHGVRGEVKVYPTTDDVMRFKKLDKVILDLGRGETRELKIRQVKFFKNMVILKFDGVDTMNEVEGWRQKDLLALLRLPFIIRVILRFSMDPELQKNIFREFLIFLYFTY